jgi:hypothetical protein
VKALTTADSKKKDTDIEHYQRLIELRIQLGEALLVFHGEYPRSHRPPTILQLFQEFLNLLESAGQILAESSRIITCTLTDTS